MSNSTFTIEDKVYIFNMEEKFISEATIINLGLRDDTIVADIVIKQKNNKSIILKDVDVSFLFLTYHECLMFALDMLKGTICINSEEKCPFIDMEFEAKEDFRSNCYSGIDLWLNEKIFKNKEKGTFIECGANDGSTDSISYFFEKNFNWSGILIEPISELMKKCKKCRSEENIFIQKGLSNKDTTLDMQIPNDNLDNSSFNMSEEHKNKLKEYGMGKTYRIQKIDVISYSSMIKESKLKSIDLAIFDVEGHEPYVLKSVMESDILPFIMVVEHDWVDKRELYEIVKEKYDVLKEFSSDIIFKLKD